MSTSASAACAAAGDDYLTKPFAFGELLARVDALGRRGVDAGAERSLQVGDLHMDLLSRKRDARQPRHQPAAARVQAARIPDAPRRPGGDAHHDAGDVWDYHFDPQTNVVDVHISKLRQKIELEGETALLRTVRNAGYMLSEHE